MGTSEEMETVLDRLAWALRLDRAGLDAHPVGSRLAAMARHMDQFEHDRGAPVREITARLGDRWSPLLLLVLSQGRLGHATLRRVVAALSAEGAISQRMLTLRLRALERDGLVRRHVTPSVPPRVDYEITLLGGELVAILNTLLRWIEAKTPQIEASRRRFERDAVDD